MGFFKNLFGSARRIKFEEMLLGKRSRTVAIVETYESPEISNADTDTPNFGRAVFKLRINGLWESHRVTILEDVGRINRGDQWIVKLDGSLTRIVAIHICLCKKSPPIA